MKGCAVSKRVFRTESLGATLPAAAQRVFLRAAASIGAGAATATDLVLDNVVLAADGGL